MKRRSTRAEKIALLSKMVNGQARGQDLTQYRAKQRDAWFMVVTDNKDPEPDDLVEVWPRNGGGIKKIPYGEFERDPIYYGCKCIVIDF